jgi:hypothetical protein
MERLSQDNTSENNEGKSMFGCGKELKDALAQVDTAKQEKMELEVKVQLLESALESALQSSVPTIIGVNKENNVSETSKVDDLENTGNRSEQRGSDLVVKAIEKVSSRENIVSVPVKRRQERALKSIMITR